VKAVLLAAGAATRLRPLTDDTPKCLLLVAGVPILRREVDHLFSIGVTELVVVTGFQHEKIRNALADWLPATPVRFLHNHVWATTNNSYSLLLARPEVDGRDFLLLDGDIVFDRAVLERLLAGPPAALALRPARNLGAEEIKVEIDAEARVLAIGKHVPAERAAGESIGIERFSAAASTALYANLHERVHEHGLVNEWYEASFQQMIDRGTGLWAVSVESAFCAEIDTAEDLAATEEALIRAAGSAGP